MTTLPFRPDGVLFDCDSTLSDIEGIDKLAQRAGCYEQIAALTNQAMNGEVPLEAVYSKRLDIIRPNREDIEAIAALYMAHITDGAREIIATLHQHHIMTGIISGGLRPAILPLAQVLGIHSTDVYAVDIDFADDGSYRNVCPSPLTTAEGKRSIAAAWKAQHNLKHTVLIGDGASDIAALGGVDAVIGYAGIIARENVIKQATLCYRDRDLRGILTLLNTAS